MEVGEVESLDSRRVGVVKGYMVFRGIEVQDILQAPEGG